MPAFDAVGPDASGDSVTQITWDHTVGSGSDLYLAVGVQTRQGVDVTDVTVEGSSIAFAVGVSSTDVITRVEVWEKVAPTPGAGNNTIVATMASSQRMAGLSMSFTGVDAASPRANTVTEGTSANSTTQSETLSSSTGQFCCDFAGASGGGQATLTADAGQTERNEVIESGSGNDLAFGCSTEPGAASVTMGWSSTISSAWAHVLLSLRPAAAGDTNLVIQDAAHGHTADSLVLTQVHALVVADALHGHTVDNLDLTQVHLLAIADAAHAHTADNLVLTVAGDLVIQDALHAHTADNLDLTQVHTLVIADAAHGHAADNVVLDVSVVLSIADALHAHAAEGLTLTQAHLLAIADALHAHAAESPAIVQQHMLVIADALHSHAVDNVVLVDGSIVLVTDPTRRVVILADDRTVWVGVRRLH